MSDDWPRYLYSDVDAFRLDDGRVMVNEGRGNVVEYVRKDGKQWGTRGTGSTTNAPAASR